MYVVDGTPHQDGHIQNSRNCVLSRQGSKDRGYPEVAIKSKCCTYPSFSVSSESSNMVHIASLDVELSREDEDVTLGLAGESVARCYSMFAFLASIMIRPDLRYHHYHCHAVYGSAHSHSRPKREGCNVHTSQPAAPRREPCGPLPIGDFA